MSQDVAARLSALSQDHREGRLTTSAYRGLRAPLLDMLVTVESLAVPEQVDPSTTTRPRHRPPAAAAAALGVAGAGGRTGASDAASASSARGATGANDAASASSARGTTGVSDAASAGGARGTTGAGGAPRVEDIGLLAPADSLAEASALARTNLNAAAQADQGHRFRPMVAGSVFLVATVALVAAWMAWSPPEPARPAVTAVSPALNAQSDAPLPAPPDRTLTPMPPPLPSEPKRKPAAPPAANVATASADSPSCDPQTKPAKVAKGAKSAGAPSAGSGASAPGASRGTGTTTAASTTGAASAASVLSAASAPSTAGAPATPCRDRLSPTEFGPRMLLLPGPATNGVVFAISARPVSQAQFRTFCQRTAWPFPRQPWSEDDDPVVNITWHEARDYLAWLSSTTGKRYRLPTETEWLYFANQSKVDARWRNGNVREWLQDTPDDSLTSTADATSATSAAGAAGATGAGNATRTPNVAGAADPLDSVRITDAVGAVDGAVAVDGADTVDGFDTFDAPGVARAPSDTVRSKDHRRLVRGISYADAATDLLSARRSRDASMRDAVTGFRALREIH